MKIQITVELLKPADTKQLKTVLLLIANLCYTCFSHYKTLEWKIE